CSNSTSLRLPVVAVDAAGGPPPVFRRARRGSRPAAMPSAILSNGRDDSQHGAWHAGNYHFARIRYFSTLVPFALTGTLNCAAHAAVFVYLYVELSISQSPPIGSFTSTVTDASL